MLVQSHLETDALALFSFRTAARGDLQRTPPPWRRRVITMHTVQNLESVLQLSRKRSLIRRYHFSFNRDTFWLKENGPPQFKLNYDDSKHCSQ